MRVLHFYKTYHPDTMGGVEQVINQLARSCLALDIDTDVLSLSKNPEPSLIELDGHWVHRVKKNFEVASLGVSWSAFAKFSELIKEVDVVHYHYPWPFMDLVHFVSHTKIPSVVTYHSDIVRQKNLLKLYQPLKKKFLASVDKIVATSPNYLESSSVLAEYQDKVSVIPIGLDKTTYPVISPQLKQKWQQQIGGRFFLFVGVLRYYKGLSILLDALQHAPYPTVIAGTGPLERELKAQAMKLGLKHVYFVGEVSHEDKVALLSLCYALVFPSHLRAEAFGISLLEGAMYGKPMISSEIGTGTSFININNETGYVIAPNDPQALQQAMQKLWENPEQAQKMGIAAEKRYQSVFTADTMALSYAKLYRDLVDR